MIARLCRVRVATTRHSANATEMATAVVQYAFEELRVTQLVAYTLPTNVASRRVMEKCGFEYEKEIVHAGLRHALYRLEERRFRKTN